MLVLGLLCSDLDHNEPPLFGAYMFVCLCVCVLWVLERGLDLVPMGCF